MKWTFIVAVSYARRKNCDEKIYDKSIVIVIKQGNKTLKCNEFVMGEDDLQ